MRSLHHFTFLLALFMATCSFAQQIEGIATYKSQRKFDVELDSTATDAMKEQIMAMLKKQSQKEFTLEFNGKESLYKQEVQLDDNNTFESGGMKIVVAGSGGNDALYKNLAEDRYVNQNEMFGKQFLIKDALEKRDWEMTKETKNIGEYTCFKATYKDTRTVLIAESDSETGEATDSKSEQEVLVTAWYTPQIPVQHGPSNYGGLPGLILEVNDGTESILCSKIVLNPDNGVSIKEPSKGKEVTNAEYREIMEAKMKEMNEQFQGDGRKNGGSNSFSIKIGG